MAGRLAHAFSESRRAFERTIALDSSYHLAYSHLVVIYQAGANPNDRLMLDGDSLRAVIGAADERAFGGAPAMTAARARARELATGAARGWATADPDSPQAQRALASAWDAVGRHDSAVVAAERALARPGFRDAVLAYGAVRSQFAADPAGVPRVLARALARYPADSVRGTAAAPGALFAFTYAASVATGLGRVADARAVLAAGTAAVPELHAPGATQAQPTRPLLQWYGTALELAAGLPAAPRAARVLTGLRNAEASVARVGGPVFGPQALAAFAPVAYSAYLATGDTTFATATRRLAGSAPLVELDALQALARGDTAAALAAARRFPPAAAPTSLGMSGVRAAARAEVLARTGDAGRALAWYEFLDPARFVEIGAFETGPAAYAVTQLARAALYEREGDRAKAAAAYERFLALRAGADGAFDAQVAAARAGLARVRDGGASTRVPVGR
jgi:tetratricopeptide (TPR) repeat protein